MAQIKKIDINGVVYDIYDELALHSVAELGLDGVMYFRGTKGTVAELPATAANGDVWHVTEGNTEYVWTGSKWEEFGNHIAVAHTHDFSVDARLPISADINLGQFDTDGTATVTGTNSDSTVTGTGTGKATVTHTTVSKQAKYAKVTTGTTEVLSQVGLSKNNLDTTTLNAVGTASVINSVTPTTGSVTGVSGSVTASKATAGTAIAVATIDTEKTVVTGLEDTTEDVATWTADVDANGVLSFVFTSTKVKGVKTIDITPAKANGSITPYTFSDVTVPKAATSATTVVTGVSTDTTTVATKGADVTVATGSVSSTGKGSAVGTDISSPSKVTVLNSAVLAAGAATDTYVGDVVTVGSEDEEIDLSVSVSGTAAAQTWTQTNGTVEGQTEAIAGRISLTVSGQINGKTGDPVAKA